MRGSRTDALPTFSPRWFAAFTWYLRGYVAREFNAMRVATVGADPATIDGPVVVYLNHPSWWDPLFMLLLHDRWFPGRPSYGPIEQDMLRKYRLFARLGAFGVERATRRGAATFLRTTSAVLARPGSVLWVTPQGRFADPRERPVRLAPGLAHLLAGDVPPVTVVPLALEYPFWTERKPEALALAAEPIRTADVGVGCAREWGELLEDRLTTTMDRLADISIARDASRFEALVRGGSGVGGVYDLWRRTRALVRGERFEASHLDRG